MAATLSADQEELHFFSFPIERREDTETVNPVDGTPDILIWGKATDGSIDGDNEIVDPHWSAKALQEWADTGANVRMSHDPRRPVGKGKEVHVTTDGHFVKSLICDPLCKHLIRQGVLNDYSVGISNPHFRYSDRDLDPEGKALRIITGRPDGKSRIAELSVCDRGSNFHSRFQVVRKSAESGDELVGQMVGDEDEIAKASSAVLTKAAHAADDAPVNVDVPKSATITFSPSDLAKLLEHRRIAEKRDFDRNVGGGVDRDKIPDADFAGRNRSFPIVTAGDVSDALHSIGRAGPGNYSPAKLRRNILRIARRKGFPVPDSDQGGSSKAAKPGKKCKLCAGTGKIRDGQMDCPRCHGDGIRSPGESDEHGNKAATAEGAPVTADVARKDAEPDGDQPDSMPEAAPPEAVKADGGDPHEPVLHHDDGEDDDTDSDADANEKAVEPEAAKAMPPAKMPKVPCPKCKAPCKAKAKFCGKCGCPMTAEKAGKPTPGDGVTGAAAAAVEPVPPHREPDGSAFEAFEHDASLPTVPDSSVKTAARMRELGVSNQEGMLHDLLCPAYPGASVKAAWPGADLSQVDEQGWQAKAFEASTSAPLGEFQQAAEKASQVWTAARILKSVPADLCDEIMDEAHKAFRDANPGPAKAPQPGEMHAERYNRPYITAGHSAPSPDHDGPNRSPIHPEHISAADFSRGLITGGHAADSPSNDSARPTPIPAPEVPGVPSRVFYTNTQRQNAAQAMRQMHDHIAQTFPDLCPMHGPGRMGEPPSHARPVAAGVGGPVPHGASKAADAVEAVTDETAARAAKKAAKRERRQRELIDAIVKQVQDGLIPAGEIRDAGGAVKAAMPGSPAPVAPAVAATADADLIKAALAPVLDELAEQKRMLDAIASQPDPAVTAYRGAAIAKASAAPAGALTVPQRAEHAQDTAYRAMYDQWRNSPDPDLRERAHTYLMGASGLIPRPPS